MVKMTFHMNEDDVALAEARDRWACAIVRCIQREIPDSKFVRADTEVIAYSSGGHRYEYSTPQELVDKIIKPLDTGKKVKPIDFDLGAPTVKQVQHLSEEDKKKLRNIDRHRQRSEKEIKEKRDRTRSHNRFCEIPPRA